MGARYRIASWSRRTCVVFAGAAAIGACASPAMANTATISNGYVGPYVGIQGPYHNLTRTFVYDVENYNGACEDTWNGSAWSQPFALCNYGGGAWADFCGCIARSGFNWSAYVHSSAENMLGHEDYP